MGISLQIQSRSADRDIPQTLKVHYPFNKASSLAYIQSQLTYTLSRLTYTLGQSANTLMQLTYTLSQMNSRTHKEPLHDISPLKFFDFQSR
jgi:hypothetical protein